MQTFLVIITFCLAAGFLLKKLVWNRIAETYKRSSNEMIGDQKKCGNNECGCE
jgi:hypothetical protein